ncbi:hypothetical protein BST61_g6465 [Cercospora zeina]
MDPSWYAGTDPYTQKRMRELKRNELESQASPQAQRPPMRTNDTDQGAYRPAQIKAPVESRDISRRNNSGTKDGDHAPVAGPSSSSRPELKTFYTSEGAYGPGYFTSYDTSGDGESVSNGRSSRYLAPASMDGEGSSNRGGGSSGGSKQVGYGKTGGGGEISSKGKSDSSSSRRETDNGNASSSSYGRPQPETRGSEGQSRRSRGWPF